MKMSRKLSMIFGSDSELARAAKRSRGAVCMWHKPKTQGGTGGRVPPEAMKNIVRYANRKNITLDLSVEDFV